MTTLPEAIEHALIAIRSRNSDGKWNLLLNWAHAVSWSIKKWYDIFPGSSTTWSSREVKLQRDFLSWNDTPVSWAETVLHELVHAMQYRDDFGQENNFIWWTKYITIPEFRAKMELQAECEGLRYMIREHLIFRHTLPTYLKTLIPNTLKSHMLSKKYYQEFYDALFRAAYEEFGF